jgi:putative glutamine amidotransferase
MSRPRVLISFRKAEKAAPYLDALRAAGIDPVSCTPNSRPSTQGVRGLLLTGGGDIAPSYYEQEPDPELGEIDRERDAFELGLLTLADATGMPALCICRGMQLLNVHRGGTLIQHLPQSPRHRRTDTPKSQAVHAVRIKSGSTLDSILETSEAQVNSRHHQAVDQVGAGLVVTARDAEDGVIEALEDPTHLFVIGVQWHPEDQAPQDEVQRRLFATFARYVEVSGATSRPSRLTSAPRGPRRS